jgi:membrane protease YdiL (CAAX protease family)
MKSFLDRHPISAFIFLAYAISWSVWFAIPLVAGHDWTLMKVLVSVGLGPGLAAVILDRVRGTAGRFSGPHFALVFTIVAAIDIWSLITGDARTSAELANAHAPGLTPLTIGAALAAAAVCAFIFASAATSRAATLNSITRWRAPLRWWLIALFLPAALLIISLVIAKLTGDEIPQLVVNARFAIRAALFTFLPVAIGVETGWRGWMLPELQKRFSPLKSSLLLGVVWGFWHFPLFVIGLYPGAPDGIIEYFFTGPLIALLFTWLWNRTAGNLLLAMALHMAINNSGRVLPTTTMFPVLLIGLIVALVFTEKMWRRLA